MNAIHKCTYALVRKRFVGIGECQNKDAILGLQRSVGVWIRVHVGRGTFRSRVAAIKSDWNYSLIGQNTKKVSEPLGARVHGRNSDLENVARL
jgi:hypothetical protein